VAKPLWGREGGGISIFDNQQTLIDEDFLINGKPSGLFLRVGERITGNLSMFFGITTTL